MPNDALQPYTRVYKPTKVQLELKIHVTTRERMTLFFWRYHDPLPLPHRTRQTLKFTLEMYGVWNVRARRQRKRGTFPPICNGNFKWDWLKAEVSRAMAESEKCSKSVTHFCIVGWFSAIHPWLHGELYFEHRRELSVTFRTNNNSNCNGDRNRRRGFMCIMKDTESEVNFFLNKLNPMHFSNRLLVGS